MPLVCWLLVTIPAGTAPTETDTTETAPAPAAPPPPVPAVVSPENSSSLEVSGYTRFSTRLRFTTGGPDNESDADLWNDTLFNLGQERENPVDASIYFRTAADLDGGQHTRGYSAWNSVDDYREGPVSANLYHAYVDFNRAPAFSRIRLGRQFNEEVESLQFDGVRGETLELEQAGRLSFDLFGGIPVTPYESSPRGDFLAGVGVRSQPATRFKLEGDYVHVQDERHYGYLGRLDHDQNYDDLFLLKGKTFLGESWDLSGRLATYANEFRDVRMGAGWRGGNGSVQGVILTQPAEVGNHVMAADGLAYLAGNTMPYYQVQLDGSWDATRYFALEPGMTVRELYSASDTGAFNHEYRRCYVSGVLRDTLAKDSTLTVTPEVWDGDDTVAAIEGEYRQTLAKNLTGNVGVDFSRYHYDWDHATEQENVVGGHAGLAWDLTRRVTGKISYRIENDEFETYHALQASLTYRF